MATRAARYAQSFFGDEGNGLIGIPGASILVRVQGTVEAVPLWANRTKTTTLVNPLPTGVPYGTPGLDIDGNAVFYADPGDSAAGSTVYEAMVTVGGTTVGPIPIGTIPPDMADVAEAASVRASNAQTVDYALVLADAGKAIDVTSASARSVTIPLHSSVAFPIGTLIEVAQKGAGQVTIVATGGVTLSGSTTTPAQNGAVYLRKTATNSWLAVSAAPSGTYVQTAATRNVLNNAGIAIAFADAATFAAGLKDGLQIKRGGNITTTGRDGTSRHLLGMGEVPAIDGGNVFDNIYLGDDRADAITALCAIDHRSIPDIDCPWYINLYTLRNVRVAQGYPATVNVAQGFGPGPVPGDDARLLNVGFATRNNLGVMTDRLTFNNANTVAASRASLSNLGSVDLLADAMALRFGATSDVSLSRSVAGGSAAALGITAPGGLMALAVQATDGAGSYIALTAGKVLVEPRGGTPGLRVNTVTTLNGNVDLPSNAHTISLGATADVVLGRSVAGGGAASLDINSPGGLSTGFIVDRAGTGPYMDFSSSQVGVRSRGATPSFPVDIPLRSVASSAVAAGLRVPHGVAPTSPVNGDVWTTTAGMFVRINGVTQSVNLT